MIICIDFGFLPTKSHVLHTHQDHLTYQLSLEVPERGSACVACSPKLSYSDTLKELAWLYSNFSSNPANESHSAQIFKPIRD